MASAGGVVNAEDGGERIYILVSNGSKMGNHESTRMNTKSEEDFGRKILWQKNGGRGSFILVRKLGLI